MLFWQIVLPSRQRWFATKYVEIRARFRTSIFQRYFTSIFFYKSNYVFIYFIFNGPHTNLRIVQALLVVCFPFINLYIFSWLIMIYCSTQLGKSTSILHAWNLFSVHSAQPLLITRFWCSFPLKYAESHNWLYSLNTKHIVYTTCKMDTKAHVCKIKFL